MARKSKVTKISHRKLGVISFHRGKGKKVKHFLRGATSPSKSRVLKTVVKRYKAGKATLHKGSARFK